MGQIGFWLRAGNVGILGMIHIEGDGLCFHRDTIERIFKEAMPVLHRFENNTEALATKNSELIPYSLQAIAQEPFKDQSKKAIQIIEPYLKNRDEWIRYTAADALLELVPTHAEAKRLRWEYFRKLRGEK